MKNIIYCIFFLVACNSKKQIENNLSSLADCKRQATFVSKLNFNPASAAFSTSEKKNTGLVLIDLNDATKIYQDTSWKIKGNLGPLAIDEKGNAFVAPVPFVNILETIRKNQNIIYKVDANTGELKTLIEFGKKDDKINVENAYGIVGLFYDCDSKLLYASSLQGSTKQFENGKIYCIDPNINPASIISTFDNTDAMGIGVANFNNKKHLFFGNTRNHSIYRIAIDENNMFEGNPIFCFSIEGIGVRGDDIVKKIRFTKDNLMQITGMEFSYNLTAPTQKKEEKYLFYFDLNEQIWKQL